MVKASALYIVIIIALVIALLCSALIVSAYFYKMDYQKKFRYDLLQNNLSSGLNILVENTDSSYLQEKTFSLFNTEQDSVSLNRFDWGLYDMGIAKAFIQNDTLYRVFSIANSIDSAKWAALYLADDERPLGVSGATMIRGNAYLPKSGIKTAYVDNKFYSGDKQLVIGIKYFSARQLPELQKNRLAKLEKIFNDNHTVDTSLLRGDSVTNSFLLPTRYINFGKTVHILKNIKLTGNIVVYSDTSLFIDSTVTFNNILVFAKCITVRSGFKGNGQLFATDSIGVGNNCKIDYPSCIGVLQFQSSKVKFQEKVSLGNKTRFSGTIFTYQQTKSDLLAKLTIGNETVVTGQVYTNGIISFGDKAEVDGSTFTTRFLYQTAFTRYENYLINIKLDTKKLSPYYLTSDLLPVAGEKNHILQWLEQN